MALKSVLRHSRKLFSLQFLKNADWSMIMRSNQRPNYFLYVRAFKNAKWILTDKKSGEVSEYGYSKMSKIVEYGYISWYNNYLAAPPYNEEKLDPKNVTVRYLHQVGGLIARINKKDVVSVSYSEILPDYTIECYDWYYQCQHCEIPLDEIREKGQESANKVFCPRCFEYSEYR